MAKKERDKILEITVEQDDEGQLFLNAFLLIEVYEDGGGGTYRQIIADRLLPKPKRISKAA